MNDYPPGYTGSLAAPPQRCPEEEEGFTLKEWAYWEQQQRDALKWFKVEENDRTNVH